MFLVTSDENKSKDCMKQSTLAPQRRDMPMMVYVKGCVSLGKSKSGFLDPKMDFAFLY